jgi:hypothetical protein
MQLHWLVLPQNGFYCWLFGFGFGLFCLRQSLTVWPRLALNSLCSPGWAQTHDLPVSASQMLGLRCIPLYQTSKISNSWISNQSLLCLTISLRSQVFLTLLDNISQFLIFLQISNIPTSLLTFRQWPLFFFEKIEAIGRMLPHFSFTEPIRLLASADIYCAFLFCYLAYASVLPSKASMNIQSFLLPIDSFNIELSMSSFLSLLDYSH